MTKTDICVPHKTATQLFVSRTSCLKYQNNISFPKNHIKQQKLFNAIKICPVLFCLALCCFVLYCSVQYLLFCKPNTHMSYRRTHITEKVRKRKELKNICF